MRRKKLKPTLRSIYHSPKYQPKVVLERLDLVSLTKAMLSKTRKQATKPELLPKKILPLPPRRKISISIAETNSVQENVVSSGSGIIDVTRGKRKGSVTSASHLDQEISVVLNLHKSSKSDRMKSRVLSSGRSQGFSQADAGFGINLREPPRQRPASCPPKGAVSSTSSVKKGNYEEDGFINSADDTSSREGTPDEYSSSRPWPTPKIVSVSSMAVPDSQVKQRVRKPLISSDCEAASGSEATQELDAHKSLRQPATTTSSPTKDQDILEPPAKMMHLADDAEETTSEADTPQPAQLGFWDRARKMANMRDSLQNLRSVAARVAKLTEQRASHIQIQEAKSSSIQTTICDPRCVHLQHTLTKLSITDDMFVKLADIVSESQPATEFYNPKAAVIMNLIREYTSLY